MSVDLIQADARQIPLAAESVQCVVTSPPYWGLRDYGNAPVVWDADRFHCAHVWTPYPRQDERYSGKRKWQHIGEEAQAAGVKVRDVDPKAWGHPEIENEAWCDCGAWRGVLGLEPTPDLYVEHVVQLFREVRRVLRADGTLWLNLGDSYAGSWSGNSMRPNGGHQRTGAPGFQPLDSRVPARSGNVPPGLKPKDLVGIPWRVAFALQADGWWLRSDIIWSKPNPMPESVTDRPTKAHEYLFLLTKSERYYYDADAIREAALPESYNTERTPVTGAAKRAALGELARTTPVGRTAGVHMNGRNRRTVWEIATQPYAGAHFATFPRKLVEPCVLAGTAAGDLVLDPFAGSGTVGMVALGLGRRAVLADVSGEYLREQARARIQTTIGLPF